MDIRSAIIEEHGSNCILAAGHGEAIIKQHQQLLDDGQYNDYELWGAAPDALSWAVQEAYNVLLQSAKNRWLSQVPREQMMGMLSAMHAAHWGVTIEWLPGEHMGIDHLIAAWNKANPDQDPIQRAPEWKI